MKKLSSREQTVLQLTLAVAILGLGYQYIFTPYVASREELVQQNKLKADERAKMEKLVNVDGPNAVVRWNWMKKNGLQYDASAAENRLQHNFQEWSQYSGLALKNIKPERNEQEKQFRKISFRVQGSGNLSNITSFLWQVQNAPTPARVMDIQITSGKDNMEELSLSAGISTLVLIPEKDNAMPAAPKENQ